MHRKACRMRFKISSRCCSTDSRTVKVARISLVADRSGPAESTLGNARRPANEIRVKLAFKPEKRGRFAVFEIRWTTNTEVLGSKNSVTMLETQISMRAVRASEQRHDERSVCRALSLPDCLAGKAARLTNESGANPQTLIPACQNVMPVLSTAACAVRHC